MKNMNRNKPNGQKHETAFKYVFHGQAAHASSAPWEGRNAFIAAQLMFHAVGMLRQHCRPDACAEGASVAKQMTWEKIEAY